MKKWNIAPLLCAVLICTGCGKAVPAAAVQTTATPAPAATAAPTEAPTAAPTAAPQTTGEASTMNPEEKYAGVALANSVTPEMLQPEYWLQGDETADVVKMTSDEISAFNASVISELSAVDRMFDLANMGDTIPGERVRALLAADPAAPSDDFVDGAPMPAGYLQDLEQRRNVDAVPETVTLRYGVMVDRTNARTQPTDGRFSGSGDNFFDDVQQAELYWNEPVLVLHESADSEWYYILNCRMDGWVRQDKVALFDSRESWSNWQAQDDFLVVTANRMRLDFNTVDTALSQREISMGTRLPLADAGEAPQSVAGRFAIGNYITKLPMRADDGSVTFSYVPVPVSADVSRGYLPYTRRNVLEQLFKIQGTNYGWGGTQGANDCSGITVQIYRCFGFELARNSKSLSMLPCKTLELSGLDTTGRVEAFREATAGSILYFPGHIMIYLGERGGRYYVMSAVGSVDLFGSGTPNRVLTVLINDLNVQRNDGMTWFAQMNSIKVMGENPQ